MEKNDDKSWSAASMFVFDRIKDHGEILNKVRDEMLAIRTDITTLKVRFALLTSVAVGLASIMSAVIPPVLNYLMRK